MKRRVRISIKWKIFFLVATLITCGVSVVLYRTSGIFTADKAAFVKELSQKLTSGISKNLSGRITGLQDKLMIFVSLRESLSNAGEKGEDTQKLKVLFSRYEEFDSIALLTPTGGDKFSVSFTLRNPYGTSLKWPDGFENRLLLETPFQSANLDGRGFWAAKDPEGKPLGIIGFSVQIRGKAENAKSKAWIVGILSPNSFDDLLRDLSTGINTGFIFTDEGIAIAHSATGMSWKSMADHPLVAEAIKKVKPAETGDYVESSGRKLVGSFERIPDINLSVGLTTPKDKAFEAANEILQNILAIGVIILILALAAAILFSNLMTSPLQALAAVAEKVGAGDFHVAINVQTNDEIGDLADSFSKMEKGLLDRDEALSSAQSALVQSEKMSAFGQLSAGIAHEVKNPLAGILGHAQLALGKTHNDDLKKHLEVIEKETRRCKAIVENLMKFARAEKIEFQPTDLGQVIQDTINLVDHQLSLAGCKILKEIDPCPLVKGNPNQLQQVLLNLMVNASHAMEKSEIKNVIVRLKVVNGKAQIQVADTGHGMTEEVKKKIFEPFFTTKPTGKGTGLGLSVTHGIIKEHKAEVRVESVVDQGTTFFIDFDIPEGAKMSGVTAADKGAGVASVSVPTMPSSAPVHDSDQPVIELAEEVEPKVLKLPTDGAIPKPKGLPKTTVEEKMEERVKSLPPKIEIEEPAPVALKPEPIKLKVDEPVEESSDGFKVKIGRPKINKA